MTKRVEIPSWLGFADRLNAKYNPVLYDRITTHEFLATTRSGLDVDESTRTEEWLIRSALVSSTHIKKLRGVASPHDLSFSCGWNWGNKFDFGESTLVSGAKLHPWLRVVRDPVNHELEVSVRDDFRTLHALRKRNDGSYVHPIENQVVARLGVRRVNGFDPLPFSTVLPDYLKEFLKLRSMKLLIAVVADRFAYSDSEAGLGVESTKEPIRLDDNTTIEFAVFGPDWPHNNLWMGRGTLRWNLIVDPAKAVNKERNPWPSGSPKPKKGKTAVQFVLDADGNKGPAKPFGGPIYLFFRPEVLRKYLDTPGYSVAFHMRTWGVASAPKGKGVDVGINDEGLVTAFGPDIADLTTADQSYWSSFSVVPSGGACRELFQTRMMLDPPHSPSTVELLRDARHTLDQVFVHTYGVQLFGDDSLPDERNRLSVGPLGSDDAELCSLAKMVYAYVIESMSTKTIRAAIGSRVNVDKEWKQIKLLEELLKLEGVDPDAAETLAAVLKGANKLRIADAHLTEGDLVEAFRLLGSNPMPTTNRARYLTLVDNLCSAFASIEAAIASAHTKSSNNP